MTLERIGFDFIMLTLCLNSCFLAFSDILCITSEGFYNHIIKPLLCLGVRVMRCARALHNNIGSAIVIGHLHFIVWL